MASLNPESRGSGSGDRGSGPHGGPSNAPQQESPKRDDVRPLLEAFRRRDAAALQASAQRGVHLESRDGDGCSVLHLAAAAGEPGTVQWILEAGADLHLVAGPGPWEGQDALMRAASEGHGGVVDLLLAAGASPLNTEVSGRRAIDLAHAASHGVVAQRLATVSGGSPRDISPQDEAPGLARVDDRGLGRDDGDDVCILIRASPGAVAEAWRERTDAAIWLPDAYGADVRVLGPCFLVFRFTGHPWTLLRAAHEAPDPGFDTADASHLSKTLEAETIYLCLEASMRRLTCHHYRNGQHRWSHEVPSLPGQAANPVGTRRFADEVDDTFEDCFDDAFTDSDPWAGRLEASVPAASWTSAVRYVDRHLRSVDAYAPSWGRLAGEHHRLEVAGLLPEAFERMDFLAVESL